MPPRLLNGDQMAVYLGLKSSDALSKIPVSPIRIGSRVLYDVVAVNMWLDSKLPDFRDGPSLAAAPHAAESEADIAFANWAANRVH